MTTRSKWIRWSPQPGSDCGAYRCAIFFVELTDGLFQAVPASLSEVRYQTRTRPTFLATRPHQPNGQIACAAQRRPGSASVECSPEIGAMMLTPQPVGNLARVFGWKVPVVVEVG